MAVMSIFANPHRFMAVSKWFAWGFTALGSVVILIGVYFGLFVVPPGNLVVNGGESVAIVGASGSGKSVNQQPVADAARPVLARYGVRYVMLCPDLPETGNYRRANPQGFVAALTQGNAPPWLRPVAVPAQSRLLLWEITQP